MQRLDVAVPDDLAEALAPYQDRLDELLRLGLEHVKAAESLVPSQRDKGATGESERRKSDGATTAKDLPPLVVRLDERRAALSRGRVFSDSAELIREERDERTAAP